MESLIGKQIKGFKFTGRPTYLPDNMDRYNGVVGKIIYAGSDVVQVKFPNNSTWNYPYKEALNHIVEEEPEEEQTIEQILNNIKKLTSEL
jgi:hypothetical protein